MSDGEHGGLVAGKGGALVELAVDLAVELAHGPAAAQGLGVVEGEGRGRAGAADQQDVVRPREREGAGEVGEVKSCRRCRHYRRFARFVRQCRTICSFGRLARQRLLKGHAAGFERRHGSVFGEDGFRRHRLRNGGSRGRFRRRSLRNRGLIQSARNRWAREREKKLTHALDVPLPKTTAKSSSEIARKPLDQLRSIFRPLLAALFKFHDPPTDLPIRRGHECVNGAHAGAAGGIEQFTDTTHQTGVVHSDDRRRGGLFGEFGHATSARLSSSRMRFNSSPKS